MKIIDVLDETRTALLSNKARSGLTILGIVIGISSVIAMVSIGQGAQGSIQSSIESMGSNLIMVSPGSQRSFGYGAEGGRGAAKTLTQADSDAIANEVSSIKAIAPATSERYQVVAKGTNTNTSVYGVTEAYSLVKNIDIDQGSFIIDQNVQNFSKVAVLGPTVLGDLFGEDATADQAIGQTIKINSLPFTIIGVTKTKGGTGFNNQDDLIYIPLSTAQKLLVGGEYLSIINIQAVDQKSMADVQEQVTSLLLDRHKISDASSADFSVMNQSDLLASASNITNTLTLLLGAIAGISLIVGGIGIMNMMLTTVTERTKEIGLRKAIGANRRDITLQFLAEAVLLTFIGGLIGVAIGWLVSLGITYFSSIQTSVSLFAVVLAVSVSAAIGIIFGYYPARRAARLNPIEALRYE
jgi:putative ABC transport system permease protein